MSIGVELERGPDAAERAEGDRDAEAIHHLDTADKIASTRIRNDPVARELVLTLDRRARRRMWELDSLRNRFGIGGAQPARNAKP
ncbi:MAG: hypothetical protein ACRDQX_06675 [Pseudonocardiaceae bacterium]